MLVTSRDLADMLPPSLMYSQPPQVEFARQAEQSITLHQLLDRFSHRMREQVQSRGISVRPFFAVISLSPSCQLRACGPAQAKGMLHVDTRRAPTWGARQQWV